MENEQIDTALEELESRLERLRALYEQYFLGIEKLEPAIPRKDVDRRIYVLRREKIRNTGKRFKLQTLISRYNTFQQYWQRICREIENGTYKRHLLRAEKNIGPTNLLTTAARRRFGRNALLRDSQQPAAPQAQAPAQAEAASAVQPPPLGATNPASEPAPPARPRSRTPTWPGLPTPPPPSGAAPPPPFNAPAPPVRVPAGVQPSAGAQRFAAAAPTTSSVPAGRPAPSSSPRRAAPFESLELDMDFMGDWDPGTAAKGRSTLGASTNAQPPAARRPQPAAPRSPPRQTVREEEDRTLPREPRPPVAAVAPAPAPPAVSARVAASSAPPAAAPGRRLAPPPKPKRDPALVAPPSAAPSAPPPERRPTVQRPLTERPPAPKPASAAPTTAAATSATAAVAARAKAARPRTAPAEGNVSDGKLRELHQRLAAASKSAGQPTVSFDGLSRSLKAAEAKLREKHGNRRIDFEVVLKDGKPVVKPVVR